jgi:hypothetical protein
MGFFESRRLPPAACPEGRRGQTRGLSLRHEAAAGLGLLPLLLLAALLTSMLLTTGGDVAAATLLSPAFQESPAQPGEQPPAGPSPAPPPAPTKAPAQPTAAPTAEQEPSPTATPRAERRKGSSRESSPDLVIDWSMFIDTIVVAFSYFWLCCGGLVMVVVPFILGTAYVLGQRRTVPPPGNPEGSS